jgi:hypothetical protein
MQIQRFHNPARLSCHTKMMLNAHEQSIHPLTFAPHYHGTSHM